MGKKDDKPTIRILLLGPPGVGKNCLESRFTTQTYPPLYDASLTLTSRRYYTLSSYTSGVDQPQPQPQPSTLPLEPPEIPNSNTAGTDTASTSQRRSGSASSVVSHPSSETRDPTPPPPPHSQPPPQPKPPKLSLQTQTASLQKQTTSPDPTYLVELTNYPALQNPRIRTALLSRRDYDAVILVYDVGSRASFDAVGALHGEIPMSTTSRGGGKRRARKSRSGLFSSSPSTGPGLGAGASPIETNSSPASTSNSTATSASTTSSPTGTGEIVVALVGNKCDFDLDSDDDHNDDDGGSRDAYLAEESDGNKEAAAVQERSLMHPLFRPRSEEIPLSPRSARSMPVGGGAGFGPGPGFGELRRARSVGSDGGGGGGGGVGAGQRVSVFSVARQGSLDLVPEEGGLRTVEITLPKEPETLEPVGPESEAIRKWLEMDSDEPRSPLRPRPQKVQRQREVSRFEGDLMAQSLMMNVPFCETSARTGENVEELFDTVIREVLREMGVHVESPRREKQTTTTTQTPVLARKRSVLKKERKAEEKRDTITRESIVSEHPPVLTLPGFDDDGTAKPDEIATESPIEADTNKPELAPVAQKRRRESGFGGFFKRVFTKKSAVMVTDVAA